MIRFFSDVEVKSRVERLVLENRLSHVNTGSVYCIRSTGSKSSHVQARCHPLPRIFQKALGLPPSFIIEVVGERYDSLPESFKTELISRVLTMYIPKRSVTVSRPRKGVINFFDDVEVKSRVSRIVNGLAWNHIDINRVFCLKSNGTKGHYVRARCWGLPRVWQKVLSVGPAYVIEMMGEYYDRLSEAEKDKIVIHELLHIPNGFTGGLRAHKGVNGGMVTPGIVNKWYNKLSESQGLSWILD